MEEKILYLDYLEKNFCSGESCRLLRILIFAPLPQSNRRRLIQKILDMNYPLSHS